MYLVDLCHDNSQLLMPTLPDQEDLKLKMSIAQKARIACAACLDLQLDLRPLQHNVPTQANFVLLLLSLVCSCNYPFGLQ